MNNLKIVRLCKDENTSTFFCTDNDLNDFIHNEALQDMQNGYSVTHLVKRDGFIVGFFTLVTDSIETKMIAKDEFPDYSYRKLPAMKIARLATHREFERQHIGKFMVNEALKRAYNLTRHIGCSVITVDAKVDAVPFYEKYAFFKAKKKAHPDTVTMYLNFVKFIKDSSK